MQPITEQTARELLQAMQQLTEAIRGTSTPIPVPTKRQVDPAYLPGGVEWMIMSTPQERREYNRNLRKQRRKAA